jgi:hypothetical protein
MSQRIFANRGTRLGIACVNRIKKLGKVAVLEIRRGKLRETAGNEEIGTGLFKIRKPKRFVTAVVDFRDVNGTAERVASVVQAVPRVRFPKCLVLDGN